MRKYFNNAILFLIIILSGCAAEKSMNQTFERNDFKKDKSLKGTVIDFNSPMDPRSYDVIRDTLLFVSEGSNDPFEEYVYNLKTKKLIFKFARKGKGPNEFIGGYLLYNTNYQKEICLTDFSRQNAVAIYNIDSLLQLKNYFVPKKIQLPFGVLECSVYDSAQLICYNSFYLDDKTFSNHVPCLFYFNRRGENLKQYSYQRFKYFTLNVSNGNIVLSPSHDRIWVFHNFIDRVDIFDRNLKLINSFSGPDQYKPSYQLYSREESSVVFKDHKLFRAYLSAFATKNAVYAIFDEKNNVSLKEYVPKPVELFKFSWNGDLLCRYQLDRYVYHFTIDSKGKYLYGTALRNSMGDVPELVQYKLR